jgi:hypothetical protein
MDGARARNRRKPEEIVAKLRQVEVLTGQGASIAEAVKTISRDGDDVFSRAGRARRHGAQARSLKALRRTDRIVRPRNSALAQIASSQSV